MIWILLAFSGLINFLYDSNQDYLSESDVNNSLSTRFIYLAGGNEYSVSFKEKPQIKTGNFLVNDLTSEIAELVLVEDASYLQSESFLYTDQFSEASINRQSVIQILRDYSKYNGLVYPKFGFEENDLGKMGKLRGYKIFKDSNGKDIEVTFSIEAYFGNKSAIILHGRSPSEIYPTPEIVTFFNSIEKLDH